MSEYGLTEDGFIPKPISVIRAEIEASLRGKLGNGINTMPEAVFGQLIDINSEREADIWDKMEVVWKSTSPSSAIGIGLDDVVAINGIKRLEATYSRITEQALIGAVGTIVPAGTQFSVDVNSDSAFVTDAEATLGTGADEIQLISFGAIPTIGNFSLSYQGEISSQITYDATSTQIKEAIESIPSITNVEVTGDFSVGFSVTFSDQDAKQPWELLVVNSNSLQESGGGSVTITITQSQLGEFQAIVTMTAVAKGSSYVAPAKSLIVIDTPISGLEYTTNPESAVVGRDLESDEELRIRREQSLGSFGSATTESIKAEIEEISQDIEYTRVYENEEDIVVNTWKPHSVAVYVHQAGGLTDLDQEIAEAIFRKKAGGIATSGDVTKQVTDSENYVRDINFYRATEVDIYLELDLTTIAGLYPADGDNQLAQIITEEGNLLGVGREVVVNPTLMSWISQVQGISNVVVRIGTTANPTSSANIPIGDGSNGVAEFSSWDISRIIISS